MKKRGLVFCIHLLMVILFASSYARAAGWRSPLGYAYVSGFWEVLDIYEDNLEAEGYDLDSVESWPLISFHPYVQYGSGFGVGFSIGPVMCIIGDRVLFDIPIGLDFRYTFIPTASTSPYIRAGGRLHSVSGDYVKGTTPGFFGGIGMEFLRDKRVNMGIEISSDASEIELEKKLDTSTTEDIQPCGLMLSIFVIF